jgi:hypothetical protein
MLVSAGRSFRTEHLSGPRPSPGSAAPAAACHKSTWIRSVRRDRPPPAVARRAKSRIGPGRRPASTSRTAAPLGLTNAGPLTCGCMHPPLRRLPGPVRLGARHDARSHAHSSTKPDSITPRYVGRARHQRCRTGESSSRPGSQAAAHRSEVVAVTAGTGGCGHRTNDDTSRTGRGRCRLDLVAGRPALCQRPGCAVRPDCRGRHADHEPLVCGEGVKRAQQEQVRREQASRSVPANAEAAPDCTSQAGWRAVPRASRVRCVRRAEPCSRLP